MIYPAVISTATIGAFFFLMTVIVPKLSSIFKDAGASLPIYTKIMLAISDFLVHDWYILLIVTVVAIVVFIRWHRTESAVARSTSSCCELLS